MESACLRLARRLGLTTVTSEVREIAGLPCLVVSRFDRTTGADGTVERVHQEDLCQARGYDPSHHRRGKYERHGGPGFLHAAELLLRWGRPRDREQLLRAMAFTVAIGNADAHAKNLAFLHPTPARLELAPLYDTVPTALFEALPRRCAMTVNAVFADLHDVTFTDLVAETVGRRRWRLDDDVATAVAQETLDALLHHASGAGTPDRLADYVTGRCAQLLSQVP
jgi:serine/threonine protein kinase HipA of HipAB toxin-antitoxin module